MINDLETNRSYMHDTKGKLICKYKEDNVKKEIIDLSLSSGIISKYTSFVAVEERDETSGEVMKTVHVNQAQQQSNPQKLTNPGAPMVGGRGGAPPSSSWSSSPRRSSLQSAPAPEGGGGGPSSPSSSISLPSSSSSSEDRKRKSKSVAARSFSFIIIIFSFLIKY